ncbi:MULTISPECIES: phage holin family protein [unclassified Undibacterium]|uniref:phage holin family protein n=1 Tax=unclassified Undibacterium TaxID=2630295 RepID=UPI002AC99397|nr:MULTISPECIES: phage holin family protein [unclassified Undibacterium]MEB0137955.1 phage holin family protein [Undibacterium sp. CCC2.1]MEB0173105.1 phage holin family protein [Undibacterium sp. CCC1.1]MEB0174963.1 phage holin family protein [Undibacterium sp. CCC3.4]MEB0216129.1 phage holin family protein [Undibacterium sp. 5I2]WPX45406.1 phage holin family protein [Undibacterium sp. CCC3.4]
MAILDSLGQLSATMLGIVQTRLELVSVEIEEEVQRLHALILWSLAALFCACFALLLLALLLIVLFWDSNRLLIIISLLAVFGGAALVLAGLVRQRLRSKPRLLAMSLNELNNDAEALRALGKDV